MNILKEKNTIYFALDQYGAFLDNIPEDSFAATPPNGGWSYAEVYAHILKTTLGITMNIERVSHGTMAPTSKGPNLIGYLMLTAGRFPPFKVKAPEEVEASMPATKITKEEARNLLIKCRARINLVSPLIADSHPNSRFDHPRLGSLNAKQWFKFIRIHTQHHLQQLNRIKKEFTPA